jgi:small subunit ribosomal protein S8e
LGRVPANTKLGDRRIRPLRVRGGNMKYRALRLNEGNFNWSSEGVNFLFLIIKDCKKN